MITSLKNASMVSKETAVLPYSNIKQAIAKCLEKNGYIAQSSKKTEKKNQNILEIKLQYKDGVSAIRDVKRVSKPSRRMYMSVRDLRPVRNGSGIMVLSTPKGIMSDKEAKKEQVGGEALFMIW